jgi:hypothetical protein
MSVLVVKMNVLLAKVSLLPVRVNVLLDKSAAC